jgi:hypothetical protein
MSERKIIEERLKKKEVEIQGLEEKLKAARVYVQALQDVLKALAADAPSESDHALRAGSAVDQAREFIVRKGAPAHINEILEALGKGVTRESRASLTSSIAAYVRRGEIFTRPAPNTFGLIELGHMASDAPSAPPQPPQGFGKTPTGVSWESQQATTDDDLVAIDDEIKF